MPANDAKTRRDWVGHSAFFMVNLCDLPPSGIASESCFLCPQCKSAFVRCQRAGRLFSAILSNLHKGIALLVGGNASRLPRGPSIQKRRWRRRRPELIRASPNPYRYSGATVSIPRRLSADRHSIGAWRRGPTLRSAQPAPRKYAAINASRSTRRLRARRVARQSSHPCNARYSGIRSTRHGVPRRCAPRIPV